MRVSSLTSASSFCLSRFFISPTCCLILSLAFLSWVVVLVSWSRVAIYSGKAVLNVVGLVIRVDLVMAWVVFCYVACPVVMTWFCRGGGRQLPVS